ncbi:MAG TPA: acyl-CoA synthetase FdrA [Spirochaetia bacterium]|nr:acyl-CoA synthetase FdrA [Spirochaetales bacterium]HRW25707.1 acyl-CoA synthetase FdrA [Spirochaetia bacterium]
MKRITVKRGAYYDSVFLMLATRGLKGIAGVRDAIVAMATPMNVELLGDMGFPSAELDGLGPNDLVVAVDAEGDQAAEAAVKEAFESLTKKKAAEAAGGVAKVGSLSAALARDPDANVAVISVPGAYAAREARKALEAGLHTMVFSDNVSLEDEIALKKLAVSKGLLMMGPDCGTAIVNGKPLCFANVVRRGPIGVVAASGTGLQETTCLIDRYGSGISQAIGTGGRDMKNAAVGGMTSLLAIEALAADPATRVILVVGKPPAPEVAAKVVAALRASGKPAVAYFLGAPVPADEATIAYASDLEEAALLATLLADGSNDPATARTRIRDDSGNDRYNRPSKRAIEAIAVAEAERLGEGQRFLRGLYTGGTLCDEALFLAHAALGGVRSNNQTDPAWTMADPLRTEGHAVIDLGDDFFTAGKPHPMIDPAARAERLEKEGSDPETAVVLIDVVLGYGSHDDPAGACVPAIRAAKAAAAARGGYLPVIASVTGTPADPQGYSGQVAALEAEGVVVMPSNYRAALVAVEIARIAAKGGAR